MGNRLANPRQRRSRRAADAKPLDHRPSDVIQANGGSSKVDVDENSENRAQCGSKTEVDGSSTWQVVHATIQAVEAFEQPLVEEHERRQQRRERQIEEEADPLLFFSRCGARNYTAAGSEREESSLEEVSFQYTTALLLMARGELVSAADVLRAIANRPVLSPLAVDARVRLVQCLVLMDPSLETRGGEVEQLLIECNLDQEQVCSLDDSLTLQAKELLAHVLLAQGNPKSALATVRDGRHLASNSIPLDVVIQRAFSEHSLGLPNTALTQAEPETLRDVSLSDGTHLVDS